MQHQDVFMFMSCQLFFFCHMFKNLKLCQKSKFCATVTGFLPNNNIERDNFVHKNNV